MEAETIRFAIDRYRGRMTEVARRLRIGRSTLYRKLKELGYDTGSESAETGEQSSTAYVASELHPRRARGFDPFCLDSLALPLSQTSGNNSFRARRSRGFRRNR
jgi:hypothetical protein